MTEAGADSLLIYGLTAMGAHLLMSLGQTLFHQYLGHSRLGGRFFKNHIQFHHAHYTGDHVVSTHYGTHLILLKYQFQRVKRALRYSTI